MWSLFLKCVNRCFAGLVLPFEAVFSTIVRPSGANSNSLVLKYEVDDSPVRTYFKMMFALLFVPENTIPTAWRHLKPLIPSEMSSLVDDYEYTWVGSSDCNPTFSHYRWNQHVATILLLPQHYSYHSVSIYSVCQFTLRLPKWESRENQLHSVQNLRTTVVMKAKKLYSFGNHRFTVI